MNNNRQVDVETPVISALAAASKTPFLTAFKVTIGIGLARLVLFSGAILVIALAVRLASK
jgi:hypothetical protein